MSLRRKDLPLVLVLCSFKSCNDQLEFQALRLIKGFSLHNFSGNKSNVNVKI